LYEIVKTNVATRSIHSRTSWSGTPKMNGTA
jgi:hypothetical protein